MPRILASLLAALLVVGCSSIPFLSGELRMTADELTQKLARRFPVEKSVAGLLDVTLTRPVVELIAVENRLSTSFDVTVRLPLANKTVSGSLKIAGRPEYVEASRSLFLREPRVEQMRMDDMPAALSAALAAAASKIAKDVLEDKPLYVFKPEEFARYGIRYEPVQVEVRADAIVLKVK